jgi:hypothetical protein
MPPKQRQIRIESKSALAAMQQLENRSDEELAAETRFRAAAQAILGARAAERMDAKRTREHFRAAIAAARPQERLQLQQMAKASLALAERRPDDLKAAAIKLGQTPPSNRQLLMLRLMGLIAPPASAGMPRRVGGILLVIAIVVLLLAAGWGIVQLVALPFGGLDPALSIFWGFLLVVVVVGVAAFLGRRRQKTARAKAAEQRANATAGAGTPPLAGSREARRARPAPRRILSPEVSGPSERGWEAVDHAEERLQERAAARQRVDARRRRRRSGAAWILRIGLPLLGAAAVLATLQARGGDLGDWPAATAAAVVALELALPALVVGIVCARRYSWAEGVLWALIVVAAEIALVFGVGLLVLGLGPPTSR